VCREGSSISGEEMQVEGRSGRTGATLEAQDRGSEQKEPWALAIDEQTLEQRELRAQGGKGRW
jgi:hypothetical protein